MTFDAPYTPLWCKSNYSFLEGASHPDELVDEAYRLGLRSLALTDRDGVYGLVRAHVRARELGVQLISGAQMSVGEDRILLLAENRAGYGNLCRLISKGRLRSPKGLSDVTWSEVYEHAAGLVALWPGMTSLSNEVSSDLRDTFGDRLYALLTRHRQAGDERREHALREWARRHTVPTVAGMEILYHTPARRPLQDILTCIRHGVSLSTAGRLIRPNANHALLPPEGFDRLYADDSLSVYHTTEIAERCTFSLAEIRYRYPVDELPSGMNASGWFRELVMNGAKHRYSGDIPDDVLAQLESELGLIHELEYEGYFLTMHEIVNFCRDHHILCQGRGSAANSAVCYCLGITAVDPVRMGLLFERFLSRERAEPPDIDLDIEHNRREEVIQYVYRRYDRRHAAMVANVIRYRAKSALRDVGKALGLTKIATERLTRQLKHFEYPGNDQQTAEGFDESNPMHVHLVRFTKEIEGTPRHLSIHPGGFLLGHEPVDTLVPIEPATMDDRTVIQWDKDDVEDLGLFKVDLLGLGALNVIHRAFDLLEAHHKQSWTLATIPPADEPTFEMIRSGDTVGTFQIESRAQMAMLPRLKPRTYYDLVIEVSIVRPGPISGGMVHPYLRRRNGEEEVTYPHEILRPILEKTLGIPLFQEQVMQLAMVAADYTPGEADQLRRDMAAWRKSGRIERHRERLISRMVRKGIALEFAERVFEQIRGFGEYGFPESHAASFALLAYATAWLRRHYPAAYLCAMLNAQPMGFYSPATLVEDAKHHGVDVRAIDVQASDWDCTLEASRKTFAVRMGLRYVKGLHLANAEGIPPARANGLFASIDDLARRAKLETGALTRLAESGALDGFKERRDALWDSLGVDPEITLNLNETEVATTFDPLNDFETIEWDYEHSSHSTRGHPLGPLRETLEAQGLPDAATIRLLPNGRRTRYAGMVICRQRPGTARGVVFMTLEDETGFVNLVLWEKVFKKFQTMAKTQSFLGVTGKIQTQDGVTHLVVEQCWVPDITTKPEQVRSRDFH
ncbi:MAG: error-prone DNA polymerase [Candidatus Hydrogenedentota bacterium]